MLEVTDGQGEPYRLRSPSRLTKAGWVSSTKGTALTVTPVRWKPQRVVKSRTGNP
jgi:hypothetical protein